MEAFYRALASSGLLRSVIGCLFRDHVVTSSYRVNGPMQKSRRAFCSVVCVETQFIHSFLGAFAKLQKATVSFVMSVRPHRTVWLPLDGFSRNFVS
jgi:hypothetical protein